MSWLFRTFLPESSDPPTSDSSSSDEWEPVFVGAPATPPLARALRRWRDAVASPATPSASPITRPLARAFECWRLGAEPEITMV